jgi:predicted short-subunit dehydrogenase-like oxidoreductase (DUF2520 family)
MKIVFIGAGNLATQLAVNMQNIGFTILQIFSRTEKSAKLLAGKLNADFTNHISEIKQNADLYFITVNDNSIDEVIKLDNLKNKFMVHCAGSIDIEVFKLFTQNYGVLYPVQTFTKLKLVDFKNIPLCIEANNLTNQEIIMNFAKKLSDCVYLINSEQRKYLHLAAIFANNFTNHFLLAARELLTIKNIDFSILENIMNETIERFFLEKEKNIQTGPAIRGDINVVNFHINLLKDYPKLKKMYSFVSKSINENLELKIDNESEL